MSSTQVQRFEDMSPEGCLRLFRQGDGDIIVCAVPDPEDCERRRLPPFGIGVEFCAGGGGGGQSPHTRKALLALWEAIERDNAENPQHRGAITRVAITDNLWEQTKPEDRRELTRVLAQKAIRANEEEARNARG